MDLGFLLGAMLFFSVFPYWLVGRDIVYYLQPLTIKIKFVSLSMSWELEMTNRLRIGFALGWSYYSVDKKHDWSELIVYLGLISITLKIYKDE